MLPQPQPVTSLAWKTALACWSPATPTAMPGPGRCRHRSCPPTAASTASPLPRGRAYPRGRRQQPAALEPGHPRATGGHGGARPGGHDRQRGGLPRRRDHAGGRLQRRGPAALEGRPRQVARPAQPAGPGVREGPGGIHRGQPARPAAGHQRRRRDRAAVVGHRPGASPAGRDPARLGHLRVLGGVQPGRADARGGERGRPDPAVEREPARPRGEDRRAAGRPVELRHLGRVQPGRPHPGRRERRQDRAAVERHRPGPAVRWPPRSPARPATCTR